MRSWARRRNGLLSHEDGYHEGDLPVLATYKLRAREERADLGGAEVFLWKSGSSFEYALARNPWLKEMKLLRTGQYSSHPEANGVEPHIFPRSCGLVERDVRTPLRSRRGGRG